MASLFIDASWCAWSWLGWQSWPGTSSPCSRKWFSRETAYFRKLRPSIFGLSPYKSVWNPAGSPAHFVMGSNRIGLTPNFLPNSRLIHPSARYIMYCVSSCLGSSICIRSAHFVICSFRIGLSQFCSAEIESESGLFQKLYHNEVMEDDDLGEHG